MKRLSRLKLQMKERVSTADNKTEYDPRLLTLIVQENRTKVVIKWLVEFIKTAIGPNESHKINDLEELAISMRHFGRMISTTTANYGQALVRVGETEERLGSIEKEYILSVHMAYINPMEIYISRFNSKNIDKEKATLEKKRLDLDVCKNAHQRVTTNDDRIETHRSVKLAQNEFSRQEGVVTTMLLEEVRNTHKEHISKLMEFVRIQSVYFNKCHSILCDIHNELGNFNKF